MLGSIEPAVVGPSGEIQGGERVVAEHTVLDRKHGARHPAEFEEERVVPDAQPQQNGEIHLLG